MIIINHLGHNLIREFETGYFKNTSWFYITHHEKVLFNKVYICAKCNIIAITYPNNDKIDMFEDLYGANDDIITITCDENIIKKLLE